MISIIYESKVENNVLYVKAVLEDMVKVFSGDRYDPEEYGPALCETSIELEGDDLVPDNDDELIEYLEQLNVDWKIIDPEEM
jgi:hypothetical protein